MKKSFASLPIIFLFACKISVAQTIISTDGPKEPGFVTPVAQESPKEPEIFDRAEVMPQFPGGVVAMMAYLKNNLQYPAHAKEYGLEGKVIVKFIIDKDGSVLEPVILKDAVGGGAGDEAIRLVKAMPKWTHGSQRGKPVRVYYVVPVTFRLY